jgi:hypothetical protein
MLRLHWLPVQHRIVPKLCAFMYRIKIGQSPQYLADKMQTVSERFTYQRLRVASSDKYTTPRLRTKVGERVHLRGFTRLEFSS